MQRTFNFCKSKYFFMNVSFEIFCRCFFSFLRIKIFHDFFLCWSERKIRRDFLWARKIFLRILESRRFLDFQICVHYSEKSIIVKLLFFLSELRIKILSACVKVQFHSLNNKTVFLMHEICFVKFFIFIFTNKK